ncbi:Protein SRC2 [Camellia lanceoleosa]|uniref:Protein SRC2 n=1 Tax=Camellia lanceoleosa TaxID=1840588 RepID=A0ACC0HHP4_9ERIC|nr:Protein SRC2 [Camellia lanceoleosa]
MECVKLQINLISATNLTDSRSFFKTKVYATVSVEGVEHRTPVDEHGKANPRWNFLTTFFIRKSGIKKNVNMLTIKLYSYRRGWPKDRYIGKVEVSLKELHGWKAGGGSKTLSFPVKSSRESEGKLNFSYKIVNTATGGGDTPPCTSTICEIIFRVTLGSIFGFMGST